jgi:hypothetical protein
MGRRIRERFVLAVLVVVGVMPFATGCSTSEITKVGGGILVGVGAGCEATSCR